MSVDVDPFAAQWVARIIVDRWARVGMRWDGNEQTPAPTRNGQHAETAREHVARAMMRGVRYVPDDRGIDVPIQKQWLP